MPPRKRKHQNRDLTGTNILPVKSNGITYYYYTMPNGIREPLGKNRAEAIEASIILNKALRPSGNRASLILAGENRPQPLDSLEKVIDEFKKHFIPEKNYSKKTMQGKELLFKQYINKWGDNGISEITTITIAKFLNPMTASVYQKHRVLLSQIFGFAIHQGYRNDNPVNATMVRTAPKRKRKKHTIEGFNAIRAISPDWLQRAMDIALYTLQRRSDLVGIKIKEHIDMDKKTIRILQDKTRNYKTPVYIEIGMGETLFEAVTACVKSKTLCPYLLHYKPKRISQQTKSKTHPFSITSGYLTEQFRIYRDKSGVYDNIKRELRPSLHDLRGLGAYIYEKEGFSRDYIQLLTGHASKEMLDHYIQGHEEIKPVQVRADLKSPIILKK